MVKRQRNLPRGLGGALRLPHGPGDLGGRALHLPLGIGGLDNRGGRVQRFPHGLGGRILRLPVMFYHSKDLERNQSATFYVLPL